MASAYLFTFVCYGMREATRIGKSEEAPLRRAQPPYILDPRRQQLAINAVREVCVARSWTLVAVRARPDSLTLIVSAPEPASQVRREMREQVSRKLHAAGIDAPHRTRWSREPAQGTDVQTRAQLERALRIIIDGEGRATSTWVEPVESLRPWLKCLRD